MARARPQRAIVAVVVLMLLAGVLVAADRAAARYAEQRVARSLQTQLGTADPPSVSIPGFPFLAQVARGRVRTVDLAATGTTAGSLPLDTVQVHLTEVSLDGLRPSRAQELSGRATVSYAAASTATGASLAYAGTDPSGLGRVSADVGTSLLGGTLQAEVIGTLAVDEPNQTVTLLDPKVSVAGISVPDVISRQLVDELFTPVSLGDLPFGVRVSELSATDDGVVATLTGTDLDLSG